MAIIPPRLRGTKVEVAAETQLSTGEENPALIEHAHHCRAMNHDHDAARITSDSAWVSGAAFGERRAKEFLDIFATVMVFVEKELIGYLS